MSLVSQEIRDILESLGDPQRLLGAVLKQAVLQARAVRGLIFDHEQVVKSVGYTHTEKISVWRTLSPLLRESRGSIVKALEPLFGRIEDCSAPLGLAGMIGNSPADWAVVAVESSVPLEAEAIAGFTDCLQLASMPVIISQSYERLCRMVRHQPMRLRDLPLDDLEVLPNLQQLEEILIEHALRRNANNKVKAAQVLGISREGLRRKLLRQ